jgi:hypothetical protein
MSSLRWTGAVMLLALMAAGLGGCGKRARYLDPPEGTHEIYPKHYPPPDTPGTRL